MGDGLPSDLLSLSVLDERRRRRRGWRLLLVVGGILGAQADPGVEHTVLGFRLGEAPFAHQRRERLVADRRFAILFAPCLVLAVERQRQHAGVRNADTLLLQEHGKRVLLGFILTSGVQY